MGVIVIAVSPTAAVWKSIRGKTREQARRGESTPYTLRPIPSESHLRSPIIDPSPFDRGSQHERCLT